MNGTAAFLVPQQFAQGFPDTVWHGDPTPVLTAYDAAGEVLGTGIEGHMASVKAPQVGILHLDNLTGS